MTFSYIRAETFVKVTDDRKQFESNESKRILLSNHYFNQYFVLQIIIKNNFTNIFELTMDLN